MTYLENLYKRIRELKEKENALTERIKNEKNESELVSLTFAKMRIRQKIRITQRQIEYEQVNEAFKQYKENIQNLEG